jgi:hypothetical protein
MVEYLGEVKTSDDMENLRERLYHEGYDCKEVGEDAPPFHPESISIEGDGKYFIFYNRFRGFRHYYLCLRPGESAIVRRVGKLITKNTVCSWDITDRYSNANGGIKIETIQENIKVVPEKKLTPSPPNSWKQAQINELYNLSRARSEALFFRGMKSTRNEQAH